jgi:hypothetical protein
VGTWVLNDMSMFMFNPFSKNKKKGKRLLDDAYN